MNLSIDESCVGCGLCASVCPDVFFMEGPMAKVSDQSIEEKDIECAEQMHKDCPVKAIKID